MKILLLIFLLLLPMLLLATDNHKVGFGIGQTLGNYLLSPSLFTMRFRIKPSYYIAPEINFVFDNQSSNNDSTKSSRNLYGFELNNYLYFSRNPAANIIGILGVGVESDKTKDEFYEYYYPNEKVSITSNKQTYAFNFGMGYEKFLRPSLSLNLNTISSISFYNEKIITERNAVSQTEKFKGRNFNLKNLDLTIFLIWYF